MWGRGHPDAHRAHRPPTRSRPLCRRRRVPLHRRDRARPPGDRGRRPPGSRRHRDRPRRGGGRMTMQYVDEYRDAELGRALAAKILSSIEPGRHYKVMEVCGGHTHSIYKYGIDDLLPENVELVHGPGCPVCVMPMGRIDDGIALAKEEGADIRMVYSPLDALRIAKQNPDRDVVFFAIGFETTAPSTALTLKRAKAEGVPNFLCFCNHVTIVPPLRALLDSPDLRLDGFIGPGHVSTVVGARPFEFIPADYGRPIVVAGF